MVAALLGLGLVLIGAAWTLSLPYNGSADEQEHFVKALAVGGGDVAGTAVPALPKGSFSLQDKFIQSTTRHFRVPADLNPRTNSSCFILKPRRPASCLRPVTATGRSRAYSYVGVYPPLAYVAPGLAARLFHTPVAALFAARIANGLSCAVLWCVAAIAFLATRVRRGWLLTGLLLSITPAAVALAWSLNPNGPEAAGGVALVALTLAATRPQAPLWLWWVMAPVGFFLASSRPVAPVWVAFGFLVPVLLRGRGAVEAARRAGKPAVVGIGAGVLGAGGTVIWNLALGASAAGGHRDWVDLTRTGLLQVPRLQAAVISQVDWGETGLSHHLYRPWELLIAALLLAALLAGTWRERWGLLGVGGMYLLACIGIVALTAGSGFPAGGRYLLAPAVALPLGAAEVCQERLARFGPGALLAGVAVVSLTQLSVLFESARRYAVGTAGPVAFLGSAHRWEAAGGWPLVVTLSLVGAAILTPLVHADSRAHTAEAG